MLSGLAGIDLGGLPTLQDAYIASNQDVIEGDLVIDDLEEDEEEEEYYFDQGEQDIEDNLEAMANSLHIAATSNNSNSSGSGDNSEPDPDPDANASGGAGDCFGTTGLFTAM